MTTDRQPSVFRFRDFELDLAAYQLRHNGKPVHLERRPMELLVLLVSRHGQLVTRDEIVERLWSGKVIIEFDAALNTLVSKARHALHDPADAPACIETVPGKGYRFVAPIECPIPAPRRPLSAGSGRKWLVAGVPVLLAALLGAAWFMRARDAPQAAVTLPPRVAVKSIAVLPFLDLSAEQDQQYFCDGLSEEILNRLAQSRQARVIARTSSFAFRDPQIDIPTVGSRLNVSHVLVGSVRRSGDQLRISAQLLNAATGQQLWSQTYDRRLEDVFKVQMDIAAAVARELQVVIPAMEDSSTARIPQAYEHFLRAQYLYHRRVRGDLERAAQLYRHSIDADDSFAPAWAGLASTYWLLTREGSLERRPGLENMRQAAERALALDPRLVEATLRLANYYWINDDYRTGDEYRRRAAALDPDNPMLLSFSASEAFRKGRLDEAIRIYQRVVASDPLAALHRYSLASYNYYAGRLVEARNEMAVALELNPAVEADVLAFALILEGKFDPALDIVRQWPESAVRAQCLALIYHGLERRHQADAALAELVDIAAASEPGRIAEVHAWRGQNDAAFEWLQRDTRFSGGNRMRSRPSWIYQFSPFLKTLRQDPRWQPWVAAANAMSPR